MAVRRCLVTGAAGFIGSHLAERLVAEGYTVIGIDCFTDYYSPGTKERNLGGLRSEPRFTLVVADLNTTPLAPLVAEVDTIFHLAGQPGVRASWGTSFEPYVRNNVLATQALLEVARHALRIQRFVYASSSSVYGDTDELPVREDTLPRPVSPYGVTKLAAEHLCVLYAKLGVPSVCLRYFTVYGPRQRPDMAFHQFIRQLIAGTEVTIHGDGEQTRDFTYVTDVVEATVRAAWAPPDRVIGRVYNLGGGARASVRQIVHMLEEVIGTPARIRYVEQPPGEARHTLADCTAAKTDLGFRPRCTLERGLRAQAEWLGGQLRG